MQRLFCAALILLSAPALRAAPVGLVRNEYNFAAAVAKHGVRDGFLAYLAKQSITLAPAPVNAYDLYSKRKPGGSSLSWYPAYALVSAAGDLGVDTGPWTASGMQDGKIRQACGEWLTVWAQDKAGRWKILFDGGTGHAAPATPAKALPAGAEVAQLPASRIPPPSRQSTQAQLVRAEAILSDDAADRGLRIAYRDSGSQDLRLLRENVQPLTGLEAVSTAMSTEPVKLQWQPMGGSVAKSGDLGYLYGLIYSRQDSARKSPQSAYVHVWRRELDRWRLLIVLETPLH